MKHVMLDLETYGCGPDAAIKAIGAVEFDPYSGQVGEQFYVVVDLVNSKHPGTIDISTVEWWLEQSEDARQALIKPSTQPKRLIAALEDFQGFVNSIKSAARGIKSVSLWSKGPTFDEIILRAAFQRYDMEFPTHYWSSRCFRTLQNIAHRAGLSLLDVEPPRDTKHNALEDALAQVQGAVRMFKHLGLDDRG